MWNVKAKVIPVITGASGTISESLRQYLFFKKRDLLRSGEYTQCIQG
jgi:hypothetical protein